MRAPAFSLARNRPRTVSDFLARLAILHRHNRQREVYRTGKYRETISPALLLEDREVVKPSGWRLSSAFVELSLHFPPCRSIDRPPEPLRADELPVCVLPAEIDSTAATRTIEFDEVHWGSNKRRPPVPLTLRQVDPLIRQITLYRELIDRTAGDGTPAFFGRSMSKNPGRQPRDSRSHGLCRRCCSLLRPTAPRPTTAATSFPMREKGPTAIIRTSVPGRRETGGAIERACRRHEDCK
jgi:hypothetical protein